MIRSRYAANEISALFKTACDKVMRRLADVGALPPAQRTFENTVLAFEAAMADFSDEVSPLTFMGYVSMDSASRTEATACEAELGPFLVSIVTRRDLYEAMRDVEPRTDEERILKKETLRGFEKSGLKLPPDRLDQVIELRKKLSVTEVRFQDNIKADKGTVEFDETELDGVSKDFLDRQERTPEGKLRISMASAPDYLHLMENARPAETRRRAMTAYLNRAGASNPSLLKEAVDLRGKIAALMGYATWADYQTDGRMAGNAKTVLDFLNGLKAKLAQRSRDDLALLLRYKKEAIDASATNLDPWDVAYCAYHLKRRDYALDEELIREYFPTDRVVTGMFELFSKLFGVRFVEAPHDPWAPDVKMYEVREAATDELISWFYTDFIPRPEHNKYGHFAAFPLIAGRRLGISYSRPIASIVGNFNPPTGDKPSLLRHGEVQTLFHEFGHIMHQVLTRAPYASLSGTQVHQDFVETPSQALENWVWSADTLLSLSGHYKDPSRKLPRDQIDRMIAARDFNKGYGYIRQLTFALLDMQLHTTASPLEPDTLYDDLYRELTGLEPMTETHFVATFGHLMSGYDAGYYGYLWSEVYADDVFSRFEREGLTNAEAGREYRRCILEPGRMQGPGQLLRNFLKRDPSNIAFFNKLHLKSS